MFSKANKLILFRIKKNSLNSGSSLLLYQFAGTVIGLIAVVIDLMQTFIQYPSIKSIRSGNYVGS
jgi:hypothetical protein